MNNNISLIFAFSSGVLSFLSPCVLPLIPIYLTYLAGTTVNEIDKNKVTVIYRAIGFTVGFSIIFILMGISITSLGMMFANNKHIFRQIGGIIIIIIIFGIHTTGLLKIKLFYYEKRLFDFNKLSSSISSLIMGMAFAIGWTPCIGPVLASILIYAGSVATFNKGLLLLTSYSLGLAVPFIVSAFLIDGISKYIRRISQYFNVIAIISGVILIIMGIMTFTDKTYILNNLFN
ncbi:cytochrome c biogenesis CcdA family protein [Clostridium lundense]|uniref:cytochrome c biogenesis CcdA family protein n=1 Tax=Clostridium lundense TaxID=319475 RepID=UPI000553C623|nr:cytochrome c biogenesis protein CcdA [Clostridium lundense]